jgi:hypothetical protein
MERQRRETEAPNVPTEWQLIIERLINSVGDRRRVNEGRGFDNDVAQVFEIARQRYSENRIITRMTAGALLWFLSASKVSFAQVKT